MCGTDIAYGGRHKYEQLSCKPPLHPLMQVSACPRNQRQETAFSGQSVPGVWLLVFDFAVFACAMRCPVLTYRIMLAPRPRRAS
eukprot:57503-Rhodomonas_salina.3